MYILGYIYVYNYVIYSHIHTHTDAHTHFVSLIWHTIKKNKPLEGTETQK